MIYVYAKVLKSSMNKVNIRFETAIKRLKQLRRTPQLFEYIYDLSTGN